MSVSTKTSSFKQLFPQYVAGLGVTLVLVQLGLSSGWSSPYLARLREFRDVPFQISPEEESWVASLLNVGRFMGALIGAIAVHYFGSKRTILLNLAPISLCWILIIAAKDVGWLYAARIFGGVGLGMTYSSFPLYLGEFALPEIRGSLVALATCGAVFGVFLGSIAGSYLDMEVSASIYLAPCLALMVLFAWLPESPHYLVNVNKLEEAKKSIEWYRGGIRVDEEFESVKKLVAKSKEYSFVEKLGEFRKPALAKALLLVLLLWTFMQICGLNNIIFFMEDILTDAKVHTIEPKIIVMYISAAGVLASAFSIITIDRCGRRMLLICSSFGVSVALAGLGMQFHMVDQNEVLAKRLEWLPIASIFLFELSFFSGLMNVPSTILSELFPSNIKCMAACLASLDGAFFAFASTKSFQPLIELIGQSKVFFGHAIVTIFIIPYAILYMPETKGKSLQQIQNELVKC